jgi:hypothetical protein
MIQKPYIVMAMTTIFWMVGCTSRPKVQNNENTVSMSTKDSIVQVELANNYQTPRDFQLFWKEFRQAVLDSDFDRLQQMTVFPLKTHGYQDFDPQIDIMTSDFYKALMMELNGEVTVQLDSIDHTNGTSVTSFEMIKKAVSIKEDKEYFELTQEGWYRVGNMEFTRTDLGWKLELIYLDTNDLKKKLKL